MFSHHWKTVMFGFAPKQCIPFKTHEMESLKSLGRTYQRPLPPLEYCISGASQLTYLALKRTPAQKPASGLAPDFFFFFYFTWSHRSALLIATLTPTPSLVKNSFYLLLFTPSHVINWTLQQGSLNLVSASRNMVLHSCRF